MNPAQLIKNPEALLAAWQKLTEQHHHLHQPQAAALLGVPEASLVAALSGQGATLLEGDPADILAAIAPLGKLLMAVSHHAGVLIGIAKPVRFERIGKHVLLFDQHSQLQVQADAIAHLYVLIEERGLHGRQRHLQAFDHQGRALFKLLVLYKQHAGNLAALAQRYRNPAQPRCLDLPLPDPLSWPAGALVDHQPLIDDLSSWACLAEPIEVCVEQPLVKLQVSAQKPKIYGIETGYLHFSHPTMKMHSRLSLLGQLVPEADAWRVRQGTSELRFQRSLEAQS